MAEIVLSVFPGLGFLDCAFEEIGYTVVRGPDVIWGGDVRRFHVPPGVFSGVIGGPPCQPFSPLAHMVKQNGYVPRHENLIPEYERIVAEALPEWFVMEESPFAPLPEIPGYKVHAQILNNRWLGEAQHRKRRISFGSRLGQRLAIQQVALESHDWTVAVISKRITPNCERKAGGNSKGKGLSIAEMLTRQGFPPAMLDECPLTSDGKRQAIANGVPLAMGRAIALAVSTRAAARTA